ncbi:hypothetical protein LZ30DRAFT_566389, partial [Colletotrichum cereale]
MAAETFCRFPLLPVEAREMVWDRAVRPAGFRGVQHFSVWHPAMREIPKRLEHHLMIKSRKGQDVVLGAPAPADNALQASWNHNPSTYAIDAGLWTACKESYEAMRRRYRFDNWVACYKIRCPRWFKISGITCGEDLANLPSLYPVDDNGKRQYITTMPHQDLFMLKDNDASYLSYVAPSSFASMRYGDFSIGNLAVDFNPSW